MTQICFKWALREKRKGNEKDGERETEKMRNGEKELDRPRERYR